MKKIVIDYLMNIVKSINKYDDVKLAEIKYGLEGLYLTISKLIIIGIIAFILGIFRELIIFLFIYSIIRATSFGLHATKSWICLIISSVLFIGSTILAIYINIPIYVKNFINIIMIAFIFKNSPADTQKKPIINEKRRCFYKYSSTFIAIIFAYCSILIKNNFLSNCFMLALVAQSIMISPTVYKFFGLPYNNYLNYLAKNNI